MDNTLNKLTKGMKMKKNKDFWNGYIASELKNQFCNGYNRNEWTTEINNILHLYHAEIIQIPENFDEYSAPLHELKKEAESRITSTSTIHSSEKLLIEWCKHILNVLSLGDEIAILAKDKFEDGLIGYENGIRYIEQEIHWAKEYFMLMGILMENNMSEKEEIAKDEDAPKEKVDSSLPDLICDLTHLKKFCALGPTHVLGINDDTKN